MASIASLTTGIVYLRSLFAGGGSTQYTPMGQGWSVNTPYTSNGTGAQTAMTISIPANTLRNAGDKLIIEASVTDAATANNKSTALTFGGTTLASRSGVADNNLPRIMRAVVVRLTNTTQKSYGEVHCQGQASLVTIGAPGETLSGAINVTVAITDVAASDIIINQLSVTYVPVGSVNS